MQLFLDFHTSVKYIEEKHGGIVLMDKKPNVLEGEHCPYCAHSCLLTEASCRRGQTYAGELYYSRVNSPEFMAKFEAQHSSK